jgi:hypothetical protein
MLEQDFPDLVDQFSRLKWLGNDLESVPNSGLNRAQAHRGLMPLEALCIVADD